MPDYRRNYISGGSYFFTVNLLERYPNDRLTQHIEALREALRLARGQYPFEVGAWVVLPDHMHSVWTLPAGDCNYSLRWRLIKAAFSKAILVEWLYSTFHRCAAAGVYSRVWGGDGDDLDSVVGERR